MLNIDKCSGSRVDVFVLKVFPVSSLKVINLTISTANANNSTTTSYYFYKNKTGLQQSKQSKVEADFQ